MKAAVLAAGKGERLRPLTETRPKPLLPVLDEPLLCRALRLALGHPRVDEAVLVVSPSVHKALEGLRCMDGFEGRVKVVVQDPPRGTGDALLRAVEAAGEDDYLVVYSDVYLPRRLWGTVHSMKPGELLLAEVDDPSQYGVAVLGGEGKIEGFVEKPEKGAEPSRLALTGIYAIPRESLRFLGGIKPSPRGEIELTDLLNAAAREGMLSYKTIEGGWRDVGRPWDYLLAVRDALEELEARVEGDVHPSAVVEGRVYVAPGAVVGPHTVIEGPAYIGAGARVGPGAHVRPYTAIHEHARVGFAVEVKASVLLEGAKAPHLNYVGDSIVGEHVNLGAGTITANLRFDHGVIKMTVKGARIPTGLRKLGAVIGGHAQTGINVSIMPGVRIGSYAWIWPGCVVSRDVPSHARYRC